jgi:lipopolysaccharide assembly protein B
MPDNLLFYLLLVAAVAAGYLLGRAEQRRRLAARRMSQAYVTSLNELVKEQKNPEIDDLVAAITAQADSIDTRLALGALVRRRGEVDKAIRIHQGLLEASELGPAQRSQTELELARDYMAAGLLDRAEGLLIELANRDPTERQFAERALLEIYQRESEWQQAVDTGQQLARHDAVVAGRLAHFQCELAQAALQREDLPLARRELARGWKFDPTCTRLSLLSAQVESAAGEYQEARRLLRQAVAGDADCIPLAVPLYAAATRAPADQADYVAFLEWCLEQRPFLPVVQELAAHVEAQRGPGAAAEFVVEQLLRNPTLGGFVSLLEYLGRDGQPLDPQRLEQVHRYSRALLDRQPAYRCRECGFTTRLLMWQCPSCHEWGKVKPLISDAPRPA